MCIHVASRPDMNALIAEAFDLLVELETAERLLVELETAERLSELKTVKHLLVGLETAECLLVGLGTAELETAKHLIELERVKHLLKELERVERLLKELGTTTYLLRKPEATRRLLEERLLKELEATRHLLKELERIERLLKELGTTARLLRELEVTRHRLKELERIECLYNRKIPPPRAGAVWFCSVEGCSEVELSRLGYWSRTVKQLTQEFSPEKLTEFDRWLTTATKTVARCSSLQELTELAHQSVSQLTTCFAQAVLAEFRHCLPSAAEAFAALVASKKKEESEQQKLTEFAQQLGQRGQSIIDLTTVLFWLYRAVGEEKTGAPRRLCHSLGRLRESTKLSPLELAYKLAPFAVSERQIRRWLNGDAQSGREPTIGAKDLLKDILALFCKVSQSCGDCGLVEVRFAFHYATKINPWYTPFPATLLDIFWQAIEAEEALKTDVLKCVLACLKEVRQQEERRQQSDDIYAQTILTLVEISENEEELSWFFEGLCGVPAGTCCLGGASEGEPQ